ncbi:ABC transporter permease subunit [Paenibacillus sp. GCM10023248]|uniref:carbohydrate ABC transporter permease n=1 Tax=Bacillales TaxID=1385 RepID=UPI002378EAB5|nr:MULTISPECIES: sugar ABC transporter permease [Bacillales]MDD9269622.1 sugar ABC transporter permease [Paenibacillus sp. MAHUQ-63]MDR6880743.1 multiple sugar transport system permease protein [Bacillus sp. 3255]
MFNSSKNSKKTKEARLAYVLILPAALLIAAIAIWPVLRSVWISLYDIRLNDPTRSEIHTTYALDMEKYTQTFPILLRTIDKEAEASTEIHTQLEPLKQKVNQIREELEADPELKAKYEQIDRLLFDFKPVPDELKYVDLNNQKAERIQAELVDLHDRLAQLKETGALQRPDDPIGLTNALQDAFMKPNFVGLAHYKRFMTDSRLWHALGNTSLFTVYAVSMEMLFGLLIALLINRSFRGRGLVRAAVLIPWATPTAISAMIWHFLYDGQNGVVAKFFAEIGVISDMSTLLSTKQGALFSIVLADTWKTAPFVALLLLAGLQTISSSLYEAAQMDGANKWGQFVHITLPSLKTTFLVALMFRTLDAFRVFDLIYVLTGGGPANATESLSIYAYKTMFSELDFGAGSALAVIVFICIAVICTIYVKILGGDVVSKRGG